MNLFARMLLPLGPAFLAAGCVTSGNVNAETCQRVDSANLFSASGPGVQRLSVSMDCMDAKIAVMFLTHPNATSEMTALGVTFTEELDEKAKKMITDKVPNYDEIRASVVIVGDEKRGKKGCTTQAITAGNESYRGLVCKID